MNEFGNVNWVNGSRVFSVAKTGTKRVREIRCEGEPMEYLSTANENQNPDKTNAEKRTKRKKKPRNYRGMLGSNRILRQFHPPLENLYSFSADAISQAKRKRRIAK